MDAPKTRKEVRHERKKKKIAAHLEIAKLNENDKQALKNKERDSSFDHDESPCQKRKKLNNDECKPEKEAKNLQQEDLAELRRLLKERYRAIKNTPLLRLKEPMGGDAQLTVEPNKRVPLFLSDVQHLILYLLLVRESPSTPRWCSISRAVAISSISILFIENAGMSDFLLWKDQLPALSVSKFPFQMEVLMPCAYRGNLAQEFCAVPLSIQQHNRAVQEHGSLEAAVKSFDVFKVLRAFFPIEENSSTHVTKEEDVNENNPSSLSQSSMEDCNRTLPPSDKFPRTQLLLSSWQMLDEGYPILINSKTNEKFKDFVASKVLYKEVSDTSPMYGIDCEMCITTSKENECTRVSIVNEKLETVLDTLVKPYNRITNYLTHFSGITPAMMEGVTTRLEDVQKFIQENIEPDAILLGQSLNFDLVALKMFHPYVIDTSVIFNLTGDRNRKSKLRLLTQTFLKEDIQTQSDGHCSVEDSTASMRLVQLKLSNSIAFGDTILESCRKEQGTSKEMSCSRSVSDRKAYAQSIFHFASKKSFKTFLVGVPEVINDYVDFLNPKFTDYLQEDGLYRSELQNGHVTCAITNHVNNVAAVIAHKAPESKLSIGHIKLSQEESSQLALGDKRILNRLNSWVEQAHTSIPMNGLYMVVLCGREKSSNGTCFVTLKTIKPEPVNFTVTSN